VKLNADIDNSMFIRVALIITCYTCFQPFFILISQDTMSDLASFVQSSLPLLERYIFAEDKEQFLGDLTLPE
jgi:hypothetical protein